MALDNSTKDEDINDVAGDLAAALKASSEPAKDTAPEATGKPETGESEKPAKASDKDERTAAERARDDKGRFAAKDGEKEAAAPEKAKDEQEPPAAETKDAEQPKTETKPADRIAPPSNWKGAGKVNWDKLPKPVQQEIASDYARVAQTEQRLQRFEQVIGDRADVLAATYGSAEAGIANLLAMSDFAAKNPAEFVRWFTAQRGINLAQLAQQGAGQTAAPGPGQQQFMQQPNVQQPQFGPQGPQLPGDPRIERVEQMLSQFLEQQTTTHKTQLQNDIQKFASDPAHPYFNDVREHMAALMQSGKADTLDAAYDMACWAVPDIRSSLLADSEQKRRDTEQQRERDRVAAAKAAGSSITGSPTGAKVPDAAPEPEIEDEIRRQFRLQRSA